MNYKGVIIEESLDDKAVLDNVIILSTEIEKITPKHKTPWLKQWTLHSIEITQGNAGRIAKLISKSFDRKHPHWYVDYKNHKFHYIIYRDKVFKVDLANPQLYNDAKRYGISLGIPEYQVDFAPEDVIWER